jgi:RNA polymerase sigma-70 factor (ECF subfamily)
MHSGPEIVESGAFQTGDEEHRLKYSDRLTTGSVVERDALAPFAYEDLLNRLEGVNSNFLRFLHLDAEGYHYKEIAEIEGVAMGTVMSRIHRGRKAAQALLGVTE